MAVGRHPRGTPSPFVPRHGNRSPRGCAPRSGVGRPPCSSRARSWSPRSPAAGAGQETQEGALVFQGTTRRAALCRAGKEQCRAGEDVSLHYTPCSGRAIFKPKAEAAAGVFLQGPGGSVLPPGMPQLRRCPIHLPAVFGSAEARLGASLGGEAQLRVVPFSPSPAGFLCQTVFPGALAPAKVAAGLGAAGGRVLEIRRFLCRERLPKANNRGCRLLSLPAADSCQRWRRHGAPWRCSAGGMADPQLLIPKSWSGWVRPPDFGCLLSIFGHTVQT